MRKFGKGQQKNGHLCSLVFTDVRLVWRVQLVSFHTNTDPKGYSDTVSSLFPTVTLFQIPNGITVTNKKYRYRQKSLFKTVWTCQRLPGREITQLWTSSFVESCSKTTAIFLLHSWRRRRSLQQGIFPIKHERDWKAERMGDGECPLAIETSQESLTAKKMRGVGEKEEIFPSCSFHVRRADTNTKRSSGFQSQTYPRLGGHWVRKQCSSKFWYHCNDVLPVTISSHPCLWPVLWEILKTQRAMEDSSLFSSLGSSWRLDWNYEKVRKTSRNFQ